MIVPPRPWTSLSGGGYLHNHAGGVGCRPSVFRIADAHRRATPAEVAGRRGSQTNNRTAQRFPELHRDLQICAACSRFARRIASWHRQLQTPTAFCRLTWRFAELHRDFQICAAFSKFASRVEDLHGRFANLHRDFQICMAFSKLGPSFPDLHARLQVCTAICKFGWRSANLHGIFQICTAFCKCFAFARVFGGVIVIKNTAMSAVPRLAACSRCAAGSPRCA